MHDVEVKLPNFTFYGGRQTDDVELSFLFNSELAIGYGSLEFSDRRVCLTKRRSCYNQAEVWNYAKPFLLNFFAAVGSSDMRIRFKSRKKYSDSLLLWCNERIGMKIFKEFYKNVQRPPAVKQGHPTMVSS